MSSDGIPDAFDHSPRIPDRCASCGRGIQVVLRSWEWLESFWGKVYGANLCKRTACHVKAEATPEAIEREINRRRRRRRAS